MATLFSKIAAGEIPSFKCAEDENFYAFLDINPVVKAHTLVIPRKEVDYIFDMSDADLAALRGFCQESGPRHQGCASPAVRLPRSSSVSRSTTPTSICYPSTVRPMSTSTIM